MPARVLTAPNVITLVRLACLPLFLWLLFPADERTWAAAVMGVLGASDWVDGWVARRFSQVSELGKVLDPVADRLLLLVGGVALVIDGAVPVVVAVLVLVREAVVAVATLALAAAGARRIDVRWSGKAGTFGVMFALPFFLLGDAQDWTFVTVVAWICAVLGLGFGYRSLVEYVPAARSALRDGRATAPPA
jgi:cardiolipin synthase (CMP-forming)